MATNAPDGQGYLFNSESPEELSRLIDMDRVTTCAMGGALAELSPAFIDNLL